MKGRLNTQMVLMLLLVHLLGCGAAKVDVDDISTAPGIIKGNDPITSIEACSTITLQWPASTKDQLVTIELSTDGGVSWTPLATSVTNTGNYFWTAPCLPGASYQIHVIVANGNQVIAETAVFPIVAPALGISPINVDGKSILNAKRIVLAGIVQLGRFSDTNIPLCEVATIGGRVFNTTLDRVVTCTSVGWR